MRKKIKAGSGFVIIAFLVLDASNSFSEDLPVTVSDTGPNQKNNSNVSLQPELDSINPYNGDLTVKSIDLSIGRKSKLPINVYRSYNLRGLSAALRGQHIQSHWWTALGAGWRLDVAPIISFENRFSAIRYDGSGDRALGTMYWETPMDRICGLVAGRTYETVSLRQPDGLVSTLYNVGNNTARSKDGWRLECKNWNITLNSPDGMLYDFGYFKTKKKNGLFRAATAEYAIPPTEYNPPEASETYITADTAVDPNGNWLKYEYFQFGQRIPTWTTPVKYVWPEYYGEGDLGTEVEGRTMLISRVESSDGVSINFNYNNSTGRLESIVDSSGRTVKYAYTERSKQLGAFLASVELPTGDTWKYDYQPGPYTLDIGISTINEASVSARKLKKITLPSGGSISYAYTYLNRVVSNKRWGELKLREERIGSRTLSTGDAWKYEYARGGAGQFDQTTVTGPDGVRKYKYVGYGYGIRNDGSDTPSDTLWKVGQLVEKTEPNGSTILNEYQPRVVSDFQDRAFELGLVYDAKVWAADLKSTTITRDGGVYRTVLSEYDIYGNPGKKLEYGPNETFRSTSYTYYNDPSKWIIGKLKSSSYADSFLSRNYDANGNLLAEDRDGLITTYTYNASGNIVGEVRPGNRKYSYTNYKLGIAQAESQPEGINITRVISDAGDIVSQTDGEGNKTQYTYDGLGRVISTKLPLGDIKSTEYTPTSKVSKRGVLVESIEYDSFGRASKINVGGVSTSYLYDGYDRVTFKSDPDSSLGTKYSYDSLSRISRIENADGSYKSINYELSSKIISDERGLVTTYSYRGYGDPNERQLMAIGAPDADANITLTRNERGQVNSVMQGVFVRSYNYNSNGFLMSVVNPETGLTVYERDASGNMLSWRTGNSDRTQYSYDGQNRLVGVDYPGDTPSVKRTYNKNNDILTSAASGGIRSFAYNANGKVTQERLSIDGRLFKLSYGYDGVDRLKSMTYSPSGKVIDLFPDMAGRPTRISEYIDKVTYWPSGMIKRIVYSNGLISSYGQNERLWPSFFTTANQSGSEILKSAYGYDGVGNLNTIDDYADSSFSRVFGYDALNRLTTAKGSWGSGLVSYDGVGNLTRQTFGGKSLIYTYDAQNLLRSIKGQRAGIFEYDQYGNITKTSANSYVYDDASRLVCVNCDKASGKIAYQYDGLGQRSSVTTSGRKIYEMQDSDGRLRMELDGDTLTEYFYVGDQRIAQRVSP